MFLCFIQIFSLKNLYYKKTNKFITSDKKIFIKIIGEYRKQLNF